MCTTLFVIADLSCSARDGKNKYSRLVVFKPTGWAGNSPHVEHTPVATIHHVPYSEHSSFAELRAFVEFVRPRRIIPTVNGASASEQIARFADLVQ